VLANGSSSSEITRTVMQQINDDERGNSGVKQRTSLFYDTKTTTEDGKDQKAQLMGASSSGSLISGACSTPPTSNRANLSSAFPYVPGRFPSMSTPKNTQRSSTSIKQSLQVHEDSEDFSSSSISSLSHSGGLVDSNLLSGIPSPELAPPLSCREQFSPLSTFSKQDPDQTSANDSETDGNFEPID